jgi:hypothetical protein
LTITGMLEKLGLGEFEGRQHCGLDVSGVSLLVLGYICTGGRGECYLKKGEEDGEGEDTLERGKVGKLTPFRTQPTSLGSYKP